MDTKNITPQISSFHIPQRRERFYNILYNDMRGVKGIIFDIRRYCTHDGPGIRTTIFFKGCPLRCRWCHNPESQEGEPLLLPKKIRMGSKTFPTNEWCGKELTVAEILEEAERDRPFYDESGGGVTFSGGEPFLQPEFLLALLMECRRRKLHGCVDTCGYVDSRCLQEIAPWVDLFLFDIKVIDPTAHRAYTGKDNEVIVDNLRILLRDNYPIVLRFPLIPGYTDSPENIDQIAALINDSVRRPLISILPYHSMFEDKNRRLGRTPSGISIPIPSPDQINTAIERFARFGLKTHLGG